MAHHYVFNGDADGLCALQQLLLATPPGADEHATLTTGLKREIDLVGRVDPAPGDTVTVLDLSFRTNAAAIETLIERGVHVRYFDHHDSGDPPEHPRLELHLNPSPSACTSLIVNAHLRGAFRRWAAVGAWGDSLEACAASILAGESLPPPALAALRELGACLNYNAYGDTEADLLIAPLDLHKRLIAHADPLEFCRLDPLFGELRMRMRADLEQAESAHPIAENEAGAVYVLPDAAWARRVSGTWAYGLSARSPQRAHAVITVKPGGGHVVSVRAPLSRPLGAAALCRQFPTGGGREGAAGINDLAGERMDEFCAGFLRHFASAAEARD